MELEAANDRIVIILRNLIVIFDRNGYHSLAYMSGYRQAFGVRQQADFARVVGLLSVFSNRSYDNTEGTGTVNLSENASE